MPSNILSIDSNFPSFTGEESPEQQIRALHNYLFQLREGLQYSLQNLTADNFNTAALQNLTDAQKNEVTTQLAKVYTQLNQMAAEIDRLSSRVSGTENLSGRVTEVERKVDGLQVVVTGVGGLQERTQALEDAVTNEGGLQQQLEKITGAVQVAEDGSTSVGSEGKLLHLVGQIYINGVLYEQGGTT